MTPYPALFDTVEMCFRGISFSNSVTACLRSTKFPELRYFSKIGLCLWFTSTVLFGIKYIILYIV